jgi:hypothetical protein
LQRSYLSDDESPKVTNEGWKAVSPSEHDQGLDVRGIDVLSREQPTPFSGWNVGGDRWIRVNKLNPVAVSTRPR